MNATSFRALLAGLGSIDDTAPIERELARRGGRIEVERVADVRSMRAALEGARWDLVLCHASVPGGGALSALEACRAAQGDVPFLMVVSDATSESVALEAMRLGANDYVPADNLKRLAPAIERESRERDRRRSASRPIDTADFSESKGEGEARARLTAIGIEHRLLEWQKLEAISVFAAGLAHDFNNLLSVVLSNTILVLDRLEGDDESREDLENVRLAAQRAGDLTGNLLAFTRQQTVQPRLLDVNDVLRGINDVLTPLIGPDVVLAFHLEPRLGRVFADPTALEQIILNLVLNARDAMPNGGALTIETASVVLDERFAAQQPNLVAGPYVMLRISDTGVGMDAATKARAFEPFFTTRKGKAAGLGLSTVLGLVQQSRGSIWINSEMRKGTAITVCLPQREEIARPEAAVPPSGGGETIVVVEEDDSLRAVIRGILRRAGYTVLEAENGGEALMLCEENATRIDLLLSEVLLQRLSGRQLASRIRMFCPGLRVLFMSRYANSPNEPSERIESGAAILSKPITPAALVTKVREVLDAPV